MGGTHVGRTERGMPLPPPFNDWTKAWDRLYAHWGADADVTHEATVVIDAEPTRTPLAPEAADLDAVLSANVDDALVAAVEAIVGSACCYSEPQEWYEEVRRHLNV